MHMPSLLLSETSALPIKKRGRTPRNKATLQVALSSADGGGGDAQKKAPSTSSSPSPPNRPWRLRGSPAPQETPPPPEVKQEPDDSPPQEASSSAAMGTRGRKERGGRKKANAISQLAKALTEKRTAAAKARPKKKLHWKTRLALLRGKEQKRKEKEERKRRLPPAASSERVRRSARRQEEAGREEEEEASDGAAFPLGDPPHDETDGGGDGGGIVNRRPRVRVLVPGGEVPKMKDCFVPVSRVTSSSTELAEENEEVSRHLLLLFVDFHILFAFFLSCFLFLSFCSPNFQKPFSMAASTTYNSASAMPLGLRRPLSGPPTW